MKLDNIEKMKNSASIEELNTYLIEYLNTLDEAQSCDEYKYYANENIKYLFKIKKYRLCNFYSNVLLKLGIPMELSDYPKIQEVVDEVRMLNKESSSIHKKFNTHRKAELKRIKKESPEFQAIKSEHDNILEQIRLLEEKRHLIQIQYTNWVDDTVIQIEKDAGFINPNITLVGLNAKLK